MSDFDPADLLDHLFDGVYGVDMERRISYWNRAAERISGYASAEVVDHYCYDNLLRHVDADGQELCHNGCPLAATLQDGQPREALVYLHHKEGHRVPVSVRVSPVRHPDGQIAGAVEVFSDRSSFKDMLAELEQLKQAVFIDPLTSVGNRRYGEMQLQTRLYERGQFQTPFGVVFLDIDHFKRFNDTYGHDVGDTVLTMVARTLGNMLRRQDAITRWGGEEFMVIIANADLGVLTRLAERLRVGIERSYLSAGEARLAVTASLGATLAEPGDTPAALVARADRLMYASKTGGRNRVTVG